MPARRTGAVRTRFVLAWPTSLYGLQKLLGQPLFEIAQVEVIVLPLQHRGTFRAALLDDVRQLMCQQMSALSTRRDIPSGAENDVTADRVAVRLHIARRFRGDRVVMHPDPGKVLPEAVFHIPTHGRLERTPCLGQGRSDTGRNRAARALREGCGRHALDSRRHATCCACRRRHFGRDTIRFMFQWIVAPADREASLHAERRLAAPLALAGQLGGSCAAGAFALQLQRSRTGLARHAGLPRGNQGRKRGHGDGFLTVGGPGNVAALTVAVGISQ